MSESIISYIIIKATQYAIPSVLEAHKKLCLFFYVSHQLIVAQLGLVKSSVSQFNGHNCLFFVKDNEKLKSGIAVLHQKRYSDVIAFNAQ